MYIEMSDGGSIYVEVLGEGKPLILIHGYSEDNRIYSRQKRELSKTYKLITYDVRGHGLSEEKKNINIERFGRDLFEIINKLGLRQVNLVGWSMGASIIFEYLSQFGTNNIDKLVIVEKAPKDIWEDDYNLGLFHGNYKYQDYLNDLSLMEEDFKAFFYKFFKLMTRGEMDEVLIEKQLRKNQARSLIETWKSMMVKDYRKTLKLIDRESLIIFGGKSSLYGQDTAMDMGKLISNSHIKIYDKAGHILVLEEPIKFNNDIKNFIK